MLKLTRGVLAVAVDLHRRVVALAVGELEPGLHRATDAEVATEVQNSRAARACHLLCPIRRSVVDHHGLDRDRVTRGQGLDLGEKPAQRLLFVERRDDE